MTAPATNHAGPRYAVLANRDTGDVRTFSTDEALIKVASGKWMLVCRETEHTPPMSEDERGARYLHEIYLRVVCLKPQHGQGPCPPSHTLHLSRPEDWEAEDVALIAASAARILGTDCLMWSIERGDRNETQITIETGRKVARPTGEQILGFHQIEISFKGHGSALTLQWLLRQSKRMHLSLLTDVEPDANAIDGAWREPHSCVAKLPKARARQWAAPEGA